MCFTCRAVVLFNVFFLVGLHRLNGHLPRSTPAAVQVWLVEQLFGQHVMLYAS